MSSSSTTEPTARPTDAPTSAVVGAGALLVAIVAATFWPALDGEFVYDDKLLVVANPTVWSFEGLKAALLSAYWDFLDPQEAAHIGYWRPLTSIALYLGHQLGGGSPLAFHALSIALHALATLAAFAFVRSWSGRLDAALVAALLFAVHPVHVEAVAWISSLNAPLQGLFGFLTLAAWLRARRARPDGVPRLAAVWLLLALLAKESSFALLPMLVAVDLGLARERRAHLAPRAYAPILVAFLVYYALRVGVFDDWRAGFDRVTTHLGVGVGRLVSLRLEVLGGFLSLAAWPSRLNAFRDVRPDVPWTDPAVLVGCAWIVAWAALLAVAWRRRAGLALAGLLFVPFGVSPMVARVLSIGRFPVSDRFLYLGILGLGCIAAALAIRVRPRALAYALVAVLASLGAAYSHARTRVWKDELTLFETAVAESPDSPYVWWGHGRTLLDRYRETGERPLLDRARAAFEQVVELHDRARDGDGSVFTATEDFHQANLGQGYVYLFESIADPPHEFTVPETIFRKTIELHPDSERAYIGLGTTLAHAGRPNEARAAFERALELNPKAWEAWSGLGRLEAEVGDWEAAVRAFEEVADLADSDPGTTALYAAALANTGAHVRALELSERLVREHPERASAHVQLATVQAMLGRFESAFDGLTRATRLDPEDARAWVERGKVAIRLGRWNDARESFRQACKQDPTHFEANYNFATLLVQLGEYDDAIVIYENALALDPPPALARSIQSEIEKLRAR